MEYVSPFDPRIARAGQPRPRGPTASRGVESCCSTSARPAATSSSTGSPSSCTSAGRQTVRLDKETFSKPASREVIDGVPLHGDLAVEALAD